MNTNNSDEQPYWARLEGIAPIKADYIVSRWNDEDAVTKKRPLGDEEEEKEQQQRVKKNRNRGQNKAKDRHTGRSRDHDEVNLCVCTARNGREKKECGKPTCKLSHDLESYLASKKPDIPLKQCPFFSTFGLCPYGYRCRLLSSHVKKRSSESKVEEKVDDDQVELVFDIEKCRTVLSQLDPGNADAIATEEYEALAHRVAESKGQTNVIRPEAQKNVRKMDFVSSNKYLLSIGETIGPKDSKSNYKKKVFELEQQKLQQLQQLNNVEGKEEEDGEEKEVEDDGSTPTVPVSNTTNTTGQETTTDSSNDRRTSLPEDVAPKIEKKRLDFSNKLYLAPLTTVGNLPFRRLCGTFGSDIHCSEMAMANELLSGSPTEWSLVRRHPCENIFGIQICGSRPQVLVPTAEALIKTCASFDFLDLNLGCPIDLVFKKGAGSALMEHSGRLAKSIVGMSKVLGEIPLTIKMRTGVREGNLLAHKLATRAQHEWGLGALTIHGRTRQQRYSKLADYDYIQKCVQQVRAAQEEENLAPIPIFGNGDAYDHRTYWSNVENTGVDGIMIARGALIKPWIFTEIKERRDWDISSRERLDSIGKLCEYGLEHWGSDTLGVNTTRRFVCEALSFQHRYIPLGLLERFPTRMNDRPYPYKGRDDMETLLASPNSSDWEKISSMFLGPPPENWKFTPKHKSNAYDKEEMNG